MKKPQTRSLGREKHLDHMVRVVPFIVFCYAAQSFIILQIGPAEFTHISLTILGGFLAAMIAGFITYDLKYKAEFDEEGIKVTFFGHRKSIKYSDIHLIEIHEPGQTFSNLILHTTHKKHVFYFIDNAENLKEWIEQKKQIELKAA